VVKSRGSEHSNQVRGFVLTGHGIELVDVPVGAPGAPAGRRGSEERRTG
jgi:circadian clock protein KaiC